MDILKEILASLEDRREALEYELKFGYYSRKEEENLEIFLDDLIYIIDAAKQRIRLTEVLEKCCPSGYINEYGFCTICGENQ